MFQLMEHLAIHKFHPYQLSHEITRKLRKYLNIVTVCIDYLGNGYGEYAKSVINKACELGKRWIIREP